MFFLFTQMEYIVSLDEICFHNIIPNHSVKFEGFFQEQSTWKSDSHYSQKFLFPSMKAF